MFAIHHQDQVEGVEILALEAPRPQPGEVVAAPSRVRLRPCIGRFADVVAVSPGRIDCDQIGQSGVRNQLPEHALRRRRSADVAGADEEDPLHPEACLGASSFSTSTPNTFFLTSAS